MNRVIKRNNRKRIVTLRQSQLTRKTLKISVSHKFPGNVRPLGDQITRLTPNNRWGRLTAVNYCAFSNIPLITYYTFLELFID